MRQSHDRASYRLCVRSLLVLCALWPAVICLASWPGGRGPGNRGAFTGIAFPDMPALMWKTYLGKDVLNLPVSNTLVTGGLVIVAYGPRMYGFTTDTGEMRWFKELDETPLGDLLLGDGKIIVTYPSGIVAAHSVVTGDPLWQCKLTGSLTNAPTQADTMFFFTTSAHKVDGVDARTGKLAGSFDIKQSAHAAPALLGSSFVVAYTDGKLLRVEGGMERWTCQLPNGQVTQTPVTDGRSVLLSSGNAVYAINPFDTVKPIRWSYSCPELLARPLTLDGDRLYLVSQAGRIYCVNLTNGQAGWSPLAAVGEGGSIPLLTAPIDEPLVISNYLVLRLSCGLLAVYEKHTGALVWSYRVQSPDGASAIARLAIGGVALEGNDLYFAATDGCLYHLSAEAFDTDPPTFTDARPKISAKGLPENNQVDYLGAIIGDEGSGVPREVSLTLDGLDLSRHLQYDEKSGYAYVGLDPATPLATGMHRLVMTARDYRGNVGVLTHDFITGATDAAERYPIAIAGEVLPAQSRVAPGTILCWSNVTGVPRHIIADNGEFTSADFFPEGIPPGATWCWVVPNLANGVRIPYHCPRAHSNTAERMREDLTGVINVVVPAKP